MNVSRSQLATTHVVIAVTVAVRSIRISGATSPNVSPGRRIAPGAAALLGHGREAGDEDVEAVGQLALDDDRRPGGKLLAHHPARELDDRLAGQRSEQPDPLQLAHRRRYVSRAHAGYRSAA